MGTDIHMFVERLNPVTQEWEVVRGPNPRIKQSLRYAKWAREDGKEERAQQYEKEAADVAAGRFENTDDEDDWNAANVAKGWLYDGRNYDLFAILGNVRNGTGFAGVKTGDGFNYISDERGLPYDCSDEVADFFNDDWLHSISYVTLKELIEFDWNQTTNLSGIVNIEQFKEWKEHGEPLSYCGGISGPRVEHLTNEQMQDMIDGHILPIEGKEYYTSVEWGTFYHEAVGDFYTQSIPALRALTNSAESDDIRIVFGFDS